MRLILPAVFGVSSFLLATTLAAAQANQEKTDKTSAHVKGGSPPSCQKCPDPEFPKEARKAHISSAIVRLDVTVSVEGHAENIQVLSDPGYGFAEKAVKAVERWKFKPAKNKDGSKVPARTTVEINFRE